MLPRLFLRRRERSLIISRPSTYTLLVLLNISTTLLPLCLLWLPDQTYPPSRSARATQVASSSSVSPLSAPLRSCHDLLWILIGIEITPDAAGKENMSGLLGDLRNFTL